MKKINSLILFKAAMKYFLDLDPSLSEHLFILLQNQGALVSLNLSYVLRQQLEQGRSRVFQLLQQETSPAYRTAA